MLSSLALQGGIPTNVSIVGNLVIDTPYNVPGRVFSSPLNVS